ncbi:1-(5-phosphoribosyl)-5-((5-phosphoribosylamino)methylideneamino)imidazole-4-carboxamide isomerase [Tsukamurella ocularis]|uniref:1-(5-phosphoribosyl)-5-((5- phosphoribosylamino)methylideneamino)imidazole-4- carboxamide isomerase n=1 Tax=Tsukamurella ocularis TaxID=1970234 RepID=UPI002166F1D2|nr:1-(5-phosphoribosyl)-5-((5-phosphoribosylamino)methylideneamino)imidazole-4-carboxamide isomerase [Tsukamurella ocularis]MCS3778578.1 2,4-dienoyl-CoA reductase-like NADH-dependent reductase (Old Yellow Enzyme family) [Tsukamurella ocularis]MCS3789279.1 2,4-dienoyl-CoA reductase-like NADH-dependent reductase (Old Yellow Enzyme family) [Tsukamurella ocularis]MCS3853129.1 2,4-dienoyl-CoA reductase-like NADH-dependent reductase (Old Yellow Enzyme family) [Tsukamurella ocularis]
MDFIFMLTRNDQTVGDCLELLEQLSDVPLQHIGFKDVGVDIDTLRELHGKIKKRGAQSYLEVVSETKEQALASVRLGRELGVDYVMGGTWVAEMLDALSGSDVKLLPFPGVPTGHPTVLGGQPDVIAADCREAEAAGAAGVDLLAYRASEADPIELVRAARRATNGILAVAGSITSVEQIRLLAAEGVDAFTIGQAALAGQVNPRKGALSSQLLEVLEAAAAPTTAPAGAQR